MSENDKKEKQEKNEKSTELPPPPIETNYEVKIGRKNYKYSVNTGMMPLKNEKEEHEANMFFMAYTLDGVKNKAERPLTFVFNGGPGSASVWLHLGAVGPKRVKMQDEGWMPKPPYQLEDNKHSWFDLTDMVFIDPVGTGYSRALDPENNKNFWSVDGDIKSIAEFIRLYLTRYQRWESPLFLAGESYGTTRAAGLSGHLIEKGIGLNGIILISTIINMQTARFVRGNDLPYSLYVPTYTATAWYHGKLSKELQEKPLPELIKEVETWAAGDYTLALMQGDKISKKVRNAVINKLASYTGLSKKYIDGTKLRVNIMRFCKELLREQNLTVGRLDSRFKGLEDLQITEFPEVDPSMNAIIPPYNSMFNHYVREQLGYETDTKYEILSYDVNGKWEHPKGQFIDTSDALRKAMLRNPFMKVFVGQGYYDLATPHFAAEYSLNHMGITPELHDNISYYFYEAGHMYYLDVTSLKKLKKDITEFMKTALPE
jgi:carboxypeptidase C (cathepsin A)